MLHEADLALGSTGIEGTGLTTVEHWQTRRAAPELIDEYSNCFYACRFCNRARGSSPVDEAAGRLLNPCSNIWSEHFSVNDDQIVPSAGDRDALRTETVYDLNDLRKVALRRRRRELIETAIETICEARSISSLLSLAERLEGLDREEVIRAAERLRDQVHAARDQLDQFSAIPVDANPECGCQVEGHSLPAHLAEQCTPQG